MRCAKALMGTRIHSGRRLDDRVRLGSAEMTFEMPP